MLFFQDQMSLTITLIAIVFFFLIGEVPTHLISRKTAITLLFNGDELSATNSRELEIARQIFTVLNAINLAVNFVLYCLLFSAFRKALCMNKKKKQKSRNISVKNLQINIFLIDKLGKDVGTKCVNINDVDESNNNSSFIEPLQKWFKSLLNMKANVKLAIDNVEQIDDNNNK